MNVSFWGGSSSRTRLHHERRSGSIHVPLLLLREILRKWLVVLNYNQRQICSFSYQKKSVELPIQCLCNESTFMYFHRCLATWLQTLPRWFMLNHITHFPIHDYTGVIWTFTTENENRVRQWRLGRRPKYSMCIYVLVLSGLDVIFLWATGDRETIWIKRNDKE